MAMYYGTRLSTVVLIRRDGNATFIERDIWALESQPQEQRASGSGSDSQWDSGADGRGTGTGGEGPGTPKPVDKRDSGGRDHDRVFRFQIPIPSAR